MAWLLLMAKVEFPDPALIAADLHVVVCRVLCPVTCAPCWAALCCRESNPALPAARQKGGRIPAGRGLCTPPRRLPAPPWPRVTP